MQEEIFGPILPIITYDDFDEAIQIIQSKSKPLSLYLFSEDENSTHRVLEELSFGGGAINDTLMHLANPYHLVALGLQVSVNIMANIL